MAYVTLEQLRPYLISNAPSGRRISDLPLQLHGVETARFHGTAIAPDSLRVKSRRPGQVTRGQFTLADSPTQISVAPIVFGSLVVANNASLSKIYAENIDYTFDSLNTSLSIRQGGELTAGTVVTVWFEPYHLYIPNDDFTVDCDRAEIRRLASSAIGDGETVFLDFTPLYAPFSDDLLGAAITEANGLIEREIDPTGQFGADPTLSAAALCRALEIICRAAATRELSSGRDLDKITLAWIKLADDHSARADKLLRSFRPPVTSPSLPAIS
ncbi:MAG: hypothetical protein NDJ18_04580 [candidate division Zixibacteria bacterium]|nr:hypothetical protein [candidate division Zixibacteria bacterium]